MIVKERIRILQDIVSHPWHLTLKHIPCYRIKDKISEKILARDFSSEFKLLNLPLSNDEQIAVYAASDSLLVNAGYNFLKSGFFEERNKANSKYKQISTKEMINCRVHVLPKNSIRSVALLKSQEISQMWKSIIITKWLSLAIDLMRLDVGSVSQKLQRNLYSSLTNYNFLCIFGRSCFQTWMLIMTDITLVITPGRRASIL